MKVVIDSNRIIAALIKDSTTRKILFDHAFQFFAPEHIRVEIEKHRKEIAEKASIEDEELDALLSLIFELITIIPKSEYEGFIEKLKGRIKDDDDLPYLAVYVLVSAVGLWTHDPHFQKEEEFSIYSNVDMIKLIEEREEF